MAASPTDRHTALSRARADLDRGDRRLARLRLRSFLVNRPTCREARRLLAELYRLDGHVDEAGRWGYLDETAATDAERVAFEHGCRHRRGAGWTSTSILKALRWPIDVPARTAYAAGVLERLTEEAGREEAAWQAKVNPAPLRIAQRAVQHARRAAKEKARKARRRGET
jgi:hypothetical protein